MSSTRTPDPRAHPIAAFISRLHNVLDTLAEVPAWSMTPAELQVALVDLAREQARIEEIRLRVLAAADAADVAADSAATSTGAWLAHATRVTRGVAHSDVKLAHALDRDHPTVRDALAAGRVDPGQARVIVRALAALPATLDTAERDLAEKHLVHLAGDHDAAALKILGRRVCEVIDPDAADAHEGRKLEAEEAAAARATYLHLVDNGDGTHRGRFKIPSLNAAMLTKMLHALTSPARHATGTSDTPGPTGRPRVTRPEALGHALCELLERIPGHRLPTTAGTTATVVVLLDYDKLLSGLGAAHLDTGQPISANQARRLACTAGIIPAVYHRPLGAPSVILDPGRKTRLHTEHQRIALAVRDRGCTTDGCDRPPAWTKEHTTTPPGPKAETPAWRTDASSAATTNEPTHRTTPPNTSPPARPASTDETEPGRTEQTRRDARHTRIDAYPQHEQQASWTCLTALITDAFIFPSSPAPRSSRRTPATRPAGAAHLQVHRQRHGPRHSRLTHRPLSGRHRIGPPPQLGLRPTGP